MKAISTAMVALLCLLPPDAGAEDLDFGLDDSPPPKAVAPMTDNAAWIGTEARTGATASSGRYSGKTDNDPTLLLGWTIHDRDGWKDGGTHYFDSSGRDFALSAGTVAPSSSATLRGGQQGVWDIRAAYESLTATQSLGFSSAYDQSGNLAPGLTAGAYSTSSAANRATIASRLQPQNAQTRRDAGSVGGGLRLAEWQLKADVLHEHRDGALQQSIGLNGGGGTPVVFPQRVDYDTDRIDMSAGYTTAAIQTLTRYSFSNFVDNNSFMSLKNLYNNATATGSVFALPPSNQAHQISTQVGVTLPHATRINTTLSYGAQIQNEQLAPFTGGTLTLPAANTNPSALAGMTQNYFANISATAQPLAKLELRTSYTFDGRDAGAEAQKITATSADSSLTNRITQPQSWVKQIAKAEAGYRLTSATRLTLGTAYTTAHRSSAQVTDSRETALSGGIATHFSPEINGSLSYEHSIRAGAVDPRAIWKAMGITVANTGGTPNGVAFYMAPRTRDSVKGRLTATPADALVVAANGRLAANNYHGQADGVTRDTVAAIGPDLSYAISPTLTTTFFYNYQQTMSALRQETSTTSTGAPIPWTETSTGHAHAAGAGAEWTLSEEWKFGLDYVFTTDSTSFDIANGSYSTGTTTAAFIESGLPDVRSTMNMLQAHGEYAFAKGLSLWLGYGLETLTVKDWAYGWSPTQATDSNGSLLSGDQAATYVVHTVGARLIARW
jgi:MtrB/PioB family decaheme-associated outer membrane protein